jgi:hypothetical protein
METKVRFVSQTLSAAAWVGSFDKQKIQPLAEGAWGGGACAKTALRWCHGESAERR